MERRTHLFLLGFVASVVAFSTAPAKAAYQRYSATGCTSTQDQLNINYWTVPNVSSGVVNYLSAGISELFCPIDDSDIFAKASINTLNVHVYDGSSTDQIWAYACLTFVGSNGGACGVVDDTGANTNTGNYVLHPGLSAWQDTTDYPNGLPYLIVYLPLDGGTASNLRGYFTSS